MGFTWNEKIQLQDGTATAKQIIDNPESYTTAEVLTALCTAMSEVIALQESLISPASFEETTNVTSKN